MIDHRERFQQKISFIGMGAGTCGLTDIDGAFEKDGLFVYWEVKLKGTDLTMGQQIFLENVCKSHDKAGDYAVAFLCHHEVPIDKDIDLGDCIVTRYFRNGAWVEPHKTMTAFECFEGIKKLRNLT